MGALCRGYGRMLPFFMRFQILKKFDGNNFSEEPRIVSKLHRFSAVNGNKSSVIQENASMRRANLSQYRGMRPCAGHPSGQIFCNTEECAHVQGHPAGQILRNTEECAHVRGGIRPGKSSATQGNASCLILLPRYADEDQHQEYAGEAYGVPDAEAGAQEGGRDDCCRDRFRESVEDAGIGPDAVDA